MRRATKVVIKHMLGVYERCYGSDTWLSGNGSLKVESKNMIASDTSCPILSSVHIQ